MRKYRVRMRTVRILTVEVQADTEEKAVTLARQSAGAIIEREEAVGSPVILGVTTDNREVVRWPHPHIPEREGG